MPKRRATRQSSVIATQRQQSFGGVLDRFDRALTRRSIGGAAILDQSDHDYSYKKWPEGIHEAEKSGAFDRIVIARRDGHVVYENEMVGTGANRKWRNPPQAMEAFLEERHRSLDPKEATELRDTWDRIANSSQLARDPSTRRMPIAAYRDSAIAELDSPAQGFNPTQVKAGNHFKAGNAWYANLKTDLARYMKGRNAAGRFNQRLEKYKNIVREHTRGALKKGIALEKERTALQNAAAQRPEPVRQKPAITAAESRPAIKRLRDTVADTALHAAAERPLKRARTTVRQPPAATRIISRPEDRAAEQAAQAPQKSIAAASSYGGFSVTSQEMESLERNALAKTQAGRENNNARAVEAAPASPQKSASAASSYGSFAMTAWQAEILERKAWAKERANNNAAAAEAAPTAAKPVADTSLYGSFDITSKQAASLERKALEKTQAGRENNNAAPAEAAPTPPRSIAVASSYGSLDITSKQAASLERMALEKTQADRENNNAAPAQTLPTPPKSLASASSYGSLNLTSAEWRSLQEKVPELGGGTTQQNPPARRVQTERAPLDERNRSTSR